MQHDPPIDASLDGRTTPDAPHAVGIVAGPRTDAAIRADIRSRLAGEPDLDAGDVSVTVVDGRVTLAGIVADPPAKHAIASSVGRSEGVRAIDNRLKVMRGGLPPDPCAPPVALRSVPTDSPTARDEASGRHTGSTPDRSGYYG
jgi:hypothetical protein